MIAQAVSAKLTYEDYCNAPEDKRYELLNGELLIIPSPKEPHQKSLLRLSSTLYYEIERAGIGHIYAAPFDVILTDSDVVQPDVMFVSPERAHIITPDNIRGAPDLVIEILSPSTERRDLDVKRRLYARHGVREYWIVDTARRAIELLLLRGAEYQSQGAFGVGQTLVSPTLGGFALKIDEAL